MTRRLAPWITLLTTLTAAGCFGGGGDDPELSLDIHRDADGVPPVLRELRTRQLLRWTDSGGQEQETTLITRDDTFGQWWPVQIGAFFAGLEQECAYTKHVEESDDPWTGQVWPVDTNSACGLPRANLEEALCMANLMLDLAQATQPRDLHGWDANDSAIVVAATVAPQSKETRAAMQEWAARFLAHNMSFSRFELQTELYTDEYDQSCGNFDDSTEAPDRPSLTYAQSLVKITTDALGTAREAARVGMESFLALADHELAHADSGSVRARDLRLHAGSLYYSGFYRPPELPGYFAHCVDTQNTEQTRAAIDTLRLTGPSPVDVLDETMNGDAFIDLVKSRYEAITGEPFSSSNEFLRYIRVSRGAMMEARRYSAQEIAAFDRSLTQTIDGETIPGTMDPIYAATRQEPVAPPADYYANLAILMDLSDGQCPERCPESEQAWYRRASQSLESMTFDALDLLVALDRRNEIDLTDIPVAFLPDAHGLISDNGVVNDRDTETRLIMVAKGVDPVDVVVAKSTSALQCATTGTIEGVSCDWADVEQDVHYGAPGDTFVDAHPNDQSVWRIRLLDRLLNGNYSPDGSWTDEGIVDVTMTRSALSESYRFYVLARRDGFDHKRPGSYRIVAANYVHGYYTDASLTYDQETAKLVGEALTPSTSGCQDSEVSCSGIPLKHRIPLEDELTDDGDPYESSWRHYLELARAAADEADFLAEQVVDQQIGIDQLSEGAIQDLEDACGATISIDPLATDTAASEDPLAVLAAAEDDEGAVAALQQCIGDESLLDFVAVGDSDVCLWYLEPETGAPDEGFCQHADQVDYACPRVAATDDSNECRVPDDGRSYVPVRLTGDKLLGLLENVPGGSGDGGGSEETCQQFRQLRHEITEENREAARELFAKVFVESAVFEPQSVKSVANKITWKADPGSGSALYIHNDPVIRTTQPIQGELNVPADCSPITDDPSYGCGANASGLFCASYNCDSEMGRAWLNARLARAAMVARWLGQRDFNGFEVPRWSFRSDIAPSSFGAGRSSEYGPVNRFSAPDDMDVVDGYCLNGTSSHFLWRYFNYDDGIPLTLDDLYPSVGHHQCDDNRFYIFKLSGDHRFGGGRLNQGTIAANSARAEDVLHRMRTKVTNCSADDPECEMRLRLGNPFRRVMRRGISARVSTRCSTCTNGENSKWLPWIKRNATYERALARRYPRGDFNDFSNADIATYAQPMRFFLDKQEIRPDGYSTDIIPANAFLDGLELICEASRDQADRAAQHEVEPDEIESFSQVGGVAETFDKMEEEFRADSQAIVMEKFPKTVASVVRGAGDPSALSQQGGDYGVQVRRMRSALIDMRSVPNAISEEIAGVARDIRGLQSELSTVENHKKQARVGMLRDVLGQVEKCAVAAATAAGATTAVNWGAANGAAMTCQFSMVHIGLAARQHGLELDNLENEVDQAFIRFNGSVASRAAAVEELMKQFQMAVEELDGAAVRLDQIRTEGVRSLSKALFMGSDSSGRVLRSNLAVRRRLSVTAKRYQRARRDAIRMADLAKRAIEQRFGVRMREMREDMTLVSAPATWEADLCMFDGTDFSTLRDADGGSVENFSNGYIGDYVKKLERFVESYRLDKPFQSGTDVMVASLRDDIRGTKALCSRPVNNLLYQSNALARPEVLASSSTGSVETVVPGWEVEGCDEDMDTSELGPCVKVRELRGEAGPAPQQDGRMGVPAPFRLTFGETDARCIDEFDEVDYSLPECPCDETLAPDCGWLPDANWGQEVELAPGVLHAVSWYARPTSTHTSGMLPQLARAQEITRQGDLGTLHSYDNAVEASYCELDAAGTACGDGDGDGWQQFAFYFVPDQERVRLYLRSDDANFGADVEVAGLSVARMRDVEVGVGDEPPAFAETSDVRELDLQPCEDTSGINFRQQEWEEECVPVCLDGLGSCPENQMESRCYWQTRFTVSLSDVEAGELFSHAGFAVGNYNYRLGSVGLNFVGSASRTCDDPTRASTCYSAGFIPYTLIHEGPYTVRNHSGGEHDALIFEGRIEHARALAANRYLSNPMSSADQTLIDPYMQSQLRGRPMTGSYILRVWQEPGVNFHGIEDVQLVLNYGFWTRFE